MMMGRVGNIKTNKKEADPAKYIFFSFKKINVKKKKNDLLTIERGLVGTDGNILLDLPCASNIISKYF
jgi:hypothetical protein